MLKIPLKMLERFFHHAKEGLLVLDETTTVLYANPAALKILGRTLATGTQLSKIFEPLPQLFTYSKEFLNSQQINETKIKLIELEQPARTYDATITSWESSEGTFLITLPPAVKSLETGFNLHSDLSNHPKMQFELTRLMMDSAPSDQIMTQIVGTLCKGLGFDCGIFWALNDNTLESTHSWACSPALKAFSEVTLTSEKSETSPGIVWSAQTLHWIHDLEDSCACPRLQSALKLGLRGGIGIPLFVDEVFCGALEFFSKNSVKYSASLVESLEDISRQVGIFLKRKRTEVELKRMSTCLEMKVQERTAELERTHAALFLEMEAKQKAQQALSLTQDKYSFLADAVPQIVWLKNVGGKIEYINKHWYAYTGLPDESGPDRSWEAAVLPEDLHGRDDAWLRARETGEAFEYELRIRRHDGAWRWHLVRALPWRDESGNIRQWVGTSTDIHDRKKAEEYQRFFSNLSVILSSTLDYEETIQNIARSVVPNFSDWCSLDILTETNQLQRLTVAHKDKEMLEFAKEYQKKYPPNINNPYGVALVVRSGVSSLASDISDEMLQMTIPDKEHYSLLCKLQIRSTMIVPMIYQGRVLGAMSFVNSESSRRFDKDDLRNAEEIAVRAATAVENARLYRELQTANRIKDEFLATLSHELRTPMNVILGWIQLLQLEKQSGELLDEAICTLERNARMQVQLINDLLDVSRIITGKLELHKTSVHLNSIVKHSLSSIRLAAEAKSLKLEFKNNSEDFYIAGDPDRLQQVVWNLLSNAVKFTPENGQVAVTLERCGSSVKLQVSDTGIGIEPDFLDSVFDKFRQEDASPTRKLGGLGLGLSIVRHLVELHGGSVIAQSKGRGKGAQFTLLLPANPF